MSKSLYGHPMTNVERYERRLEREGKTRKHVKVNWKKPNAELEYISKMLDTIHVLRLENWQLPHRASKCKGSDDFDIDYDLLIEYWENERRKLLAHAK